MVQTISSLLSLSVLMLGGWFCGCLAQRCHLPSVFGILMCGVGLQYILIPGMITATSGDTPASVIKSLCLILVLLRAGLGLRLVSLLKSAGLSTVLLAIIPYFSEFIIEVLLSMSLLSYSFFNSALLCSILAPISPSLVIPGMLSMIEQGLSALPSRQLMAAPIEVALSFVMFQVWGSLTTSDGQVWPTYVQGLFVPVNIILGILLGVAGGYIVTGFERMRHKKWCYGLFSRSNFEHELFLFCTCVILYGLCTSTYIAAKGAVLGSGVLSVLACGATVQHLDSEASDTYLKTTYAGVWNLGQYFLFGFTGVTLNVKLLSKGGSKLLLILFCGSIARGVGVTIVLLCALFYRHSRMAPKLHDHSLHITNTAGTQVVIPPEEHPTTFRSDFIYTLREIMFLWISGIPKATVQATLGGVPASTHLIVGKNLDDADGRDIEAFIATAAAFSVLVCAPVGMLATQWFAKPQAVCVQQIVEEKERLEREREEQHAVNEEERQNMQEVTVVKDEKETMATIDDLNRPSSPSNNGGTSAAAGVQPNLPKSSPSLRSTPAPVRSPSLRSAAAPRTPKQAPLAHWDWHFQPEIIRRHQEPRVRKGERRRAYTDADAEGREFDQGMESLELASIPSLPQQQQYYQPQDEVKPQTRIVTFADMMLSASSSTSSPSPPPFLRSTSVLSPRAHHDAIQIAEHQPVANAASSSSPFSSGASAAATMRRVSNTAEPSISEVRVWLSDEEQQ